MGGVASALAGVLALSACAVGPDYVPPVPALPEAWSAPQLQGHVPWPARWWETFDDPVLDALEARATAASPDLATAALRFAQSRVERRITASRRAPQLNAGADAARQRQSEHGASVRMIDAIAPPATRDDLVQLLSEPFNLYQAGFDAGWELDLWGRVRRSVEAADARVAAAQAALDGVRLALQAEVARNYFELRGVQRQLAIARADLAAAEEYRALLQSRADGGVASDFDATRQRAQVADLRARLPQLTIAEAEAGSRLARLLGEPPGALQTELAPRESDGSSQGAMRIGFPDLAAGLPATLAARRPDIRAAEARLHAATASIGIAVADLYPRIVLGGRAGTEATAASEFGDWGARQWSVGVSLDLPVFDLGRRRGIVTLRRLEQQEAAIAWRTTVLAAWHEVDTALEAYEAARERERALGEREAAASDARALAHARYENGLTSFLDDLDAQRVMLAARREYADSHTALANRLVMLYKALGGSEQEATNR
ncbi:MAG: efflux transporter outer membrane subunit [Steroidobacteraceae bacterium]